MADIVNCKLYEQILLTIFFFSFWIYLVQSICNHSYLSTVHEGHQHEGNHLLTIQCSTACGHIHGIRPQIYSVASLSERVSLHLRSLGNSPRRWSQTCISYSGTRDCSAQLVLHFTLPKCTGLNLTCTQQNADPFIIPPAPFLCKPYYAMPQLQQVFLWKGQVGSDSSF